MLVSDILNYFPEEILKIKVPRSVCKDSMMRIWIN